MRKYQLTSLPSFKRRLEKPALKEDEDVVMGEEVAEANNRSDLYCDK